LFSEKDGVISEEKPQLGEGKRKESKTEGNSYNHKQKDIQTLKREDIQVTKASTERMGKGGEHSSWSTDTSNGGKREEEDRKDKAD